MSFSRLLALLVVGTLCFGSLRADDEEAAADVLNQLEGLQLRIKSELERVVKRLIDEQKLATRIGVPWPVPPPTKSVNAIESEIARIVADQAMKKYPKSLEEQFAIDAEQKFRLYNDGEEITVQLKDGKAVTGHLRKQEGAKLYIGAAIVRLADLTEDSAAHFDGGLAGIKVRELVRRQIADLELRRQAYSEKIREKTEQQIYTTANYLLVYGKWTPLQEYYQHRLETERGYLRKKFGPSLKVKILYENGFVLWRDQWMTREEALEKQRLLEEQREQQDQQQMETEQPDGFEGEGEGVDGGGGQEGEVPANDDIW